MAKTEMKTATFRDLNLASMQGTLVDSPLAGYGSDSRRYYRRKAVGTFMTYFYFVPSIVVFLFGLKRILKVRREVNFKAQWSLKEPLVFT